MADTMHHYTVNLSPELGQKLESLLHAKNFRFYEVPYARFAARKPKVTVVYYQSGKLVVQGKETRDFVEFLLEPEILGQAQIGYETVLNPEMLDPRLGVDESGKGDFFGPLVIAGVYVNKSAIQSWMEAGIRDSKNIKSERRIADLAEVIRNTSPRVFTVVPIGNPAYNRLYQKMGNVNRILAWGHARVLENLLQQKSEMQPPPVRAISDQFAANPATVQRALMRLGRELTLVQRHKAESDLAVAAASILARDEFLRRLKNLEAQWQLSFPKGASQAVDSAAREFVSRHGAHNLTEVAKTHFRTALRAQDLPEPERIPFRPKDRQSSR